jgi:hypothetical protein
MAFAPLQSRLLPASGPLHISGIKLTAHCLVHNPVVDVLSRPTLAWCTSDHCGRGRQKRTHCNLTA